MPRARKLSVALLLVVAVVGAAWAADLPITVVHLTSPAAPFTDATLEVKTSPGADCTIIHGV